ncbi:UNVERIFIED_CONTAM: hypothetical protein GTU68_009323 [Idotea baltica]|nr:hypothetical protein [Idotea baltica]
MNPVDPPRLFGDIALGSAIFKAGPEDFQVEEILGFEPSGEGEHCFLWVEKTDRNSNDVAGEIADRLKIRKRLVSHCGLKDKQAVTRQWFSVHLPGQNSPAKETLEGEGIRILKITRNTRKLHRGSHDGNRFIIRLREVNGDPDEIGTRWKKITETGVPNYFGPQRFGRNGNNLPQAREFLSGHVEVRDRMLRGILISAARSALFNAVVAERVVQQNWNVPLDGEVFGFAENRSLVLPGNLRGDETARVAKSELNLTAPLWGDGEIQSVGAVKELEQGVIGNFEDLSRGLAKLGLQQERRVIRLIPQNPDLVWENGNQLLLSFDLPKGTYATTILRELLELNDGE